MLPIVLQEYLDEKERSPFGLWRSGLDAIARAKVTVALQRLSHGNVSHVKGVGKGVSELKIDFGPGYRVYFGRDGEALVILVAGGSKKRQQRDIEEAQSRWSDYKQRKQGE